jgi:RNA polymerase sigma-70 factor, ECF subfamily
VRAAHSIPPTGRHRWSTALKRPSVSSSVSLTLVPENSHDSPQVLHCLPFPAPRGKFLQFHAFDEAYVERLRAGDFRTQEHFRVYFTALIQIKLRSRLHSPEAIEDVRQETFVRFYEALRAGKIRQAQSLGSFINSMCNNILKEVWRDDERHDSLEEDEQKEIPDKAPDLLRLLTTKETGQKVREVLEGLPELDRRLLHEVFLEERDKDDVCRDYGVTRDYLRVLLFRAKKLFKALYIKNTESDSPEFSPV